MDKFSDPLLSGTTLLQGQYRIKTFLNDGGFGITYLATDSLDRPIVIKECFPRAICRRSGQEVGTRALATAKSSAQSLKRLRNKPAICPNLNTPISLKYIRFSTKTKPLIWQWIMSMDKN